MVPIQDGLPFSVHRQLTRLLEAPERLQFSWNSSIASDTVVTISLSDLDGRTRLTLTHEGLPSAELVERHGSGWGGVLKNLPAAISSPAPSH